MKKRYNKAFTIVELMLTVAIMAVVVGMATPSFIQIIRKNQLNRVAMDFVENIKKTRSDAILYKTDQTFTLTGTSAWTPDEGVVWHDSYQPTTDIVFDFMGRAEIEETFECYILQNNTDSNILKIIIIHQNGTVNFDHNSTSCPSSFAGG